MHADNDSNDKTQQKDTRLDTKKTPIDETETSPRFKDNTKKDPYSWWDENDPRRSVTDRKILESTMDCLKPVLQKGKSSPV